MKIKVQTIYHREDTGDRLHFVPLANAPGFSHRVILNRRQVDWLSANARPSLKSAQFYFEKHSADPAERAKHAGGSQPAMATPMLTEEVAQ